MLQNIIKLCIAGLIFSVAGIFSGCQKKIGCDYPFEVSTKTVATNITENSAYVGGFYIQTGNPNITEAGIFYSSTNQMPTVADSKIVLPALFPGLFQGNLEGLEPNTKYYFRAYVYLDGKLINATGLTGSFKTKAATFVKDVEGNKYYFVEIHGQDWTTSDYACTKYNDGSSIDNVTDNAQWYDASRLTKGAFCYWENNRANPVMYNGAAACDPRLAPAGWHVATKDDWQGLLDAGYTGSDLMNPAGWSGLMATAKNTTGLSLVQNNVGNRSDSDGTFGQVPWPSWWSSTPNGGNAFLLESDMNSFSLDVTDYSKLNGFRLRIVKNK